MHTDNTVVRKIPVRTTQSIRPNDRIRKRLKIAFALPCSGRYPIGGFRIIYEHANRLVLAGHDVTLLHATNIDFRLSPPEAKLTSLLLYLRNKIFGLYKPDGWFALDQQIKMICSMSIKIPRNERYDVVIASAWQTAEPVAKSAALRKYYFIQHFEDWDSDADTIIAALKLPITKIAISRWLKRLIEAQGESCHLVPNAIDTGFFQPTLPVEDRNPRSVLIQLHPKDWKGSADALQAIKILRQNGERIDLQLFGIANEDDFDIEGPYSYARNPTQTLLKRLYGEAAIFVAASWSEGWGLTPHEACACGAAVVATDIGGHQEFLDHEISALMSPIKNPEALSSNILRLLSDTKLRIRLAHAGVHSARRFTWEKSAARFEEILSS